MAIPKYNEMFISVLKSLQDGNTHTSKEIKNYIAKEKNISDDEIKELTPSGKNKIFSNRVGWACTYLKKAGVIDNPEKAVFRITKDGLNLLKENPQKVDKSDLMKFDSFKNFVNTQTKSSSDDKVDFVDTPQEIFEQSYKQINENLADEILEEIIKQPPVFFESLVLKLLEKMGYGGTIDNSSTLTKQSGDEGIDGIIKEDKLGFELIFIQAKRWEIDRVVSRPEVQKFVGALGGQGAKKGLFITTARFSKEAYEYSNKQHIAKIVLVDGDLLAKYMIEHNLGVSTEQVYEIKKIDTDFFNDLL